MEAVDPAALKRAPLGVAPWQDWQFVAQSVPPWSAGITPAEPDSGPNPAAFCAATVQVYEAPFVRPVTVTGELVPVAVIAPQVARYAVIGLPPSLAGAVNEIFACWLPAEATPIVGAPGRSGLIWIVADTGLAAAKLLLPPCSARMEQAPAVTIVTVATRGSATVQIEGVLEK